MQNAAEDNLKPIRVAQIIGKMWAGGVEAVVFNYYRNIDHSKVQFDFFYDADSTVDPPQDLIDMGTRFYKLSPYQQLPQYIKKLRRLLRENQYKIVHSHLNTLSVFPLYAAWREKVPVRIAHNHSVPGGNEFKRNTAKNVLRRMSKIFPTDYFACSEKAGRWLFGDKTFGAGKVTVIKNAIDYDRFHPDKEVRTKLRNKYSIGDKIVVGHVGRFTFAKNHDLLISVFAKYHQYNPKSVLMLVGDGELRNQIEGKIKALGIENDCILVGKTNRTECYYQTMDVVVMPSFFEGLGIAAVEAQACKVPIVLSDAIPEEAIISDGTRYVSIGAAENSWVEAIFKCQNAKVEYNDNYINYDIKVAGKVLTEWYRKKIKGMG